MDLTFTAVTKMTRLVRDEEAELKLLKKSSKSELI